MHIDLVVFNRTCAQLLCIELHFICIWAFFRYDDNKWTNNPNFRKRWLALPRYILWKWWKMSNPVLIRILRSVLALRQIKYTAYSILRFPIAHESKKKKNDKAWCDLFSERCQKYRREVVCDEKLGQKEVDNFI